jgi:hypothetical protein
MKLLALLPFGTAMVILSACAPVAPSEGAIQTAIAQTQAAAPTPTPIPFSALDLEDVVITDGDLPAGFEPSQIRSELGDLSNDAATPDYFFSQSVSHGGGFGGMVDVLVYEDSAQVEPAYAALANSMPGDARDVAIGEKASAASDFRIIEVASLTFVRCHAVVSIQFQGTANIDDVVAYATRLDKRLEPLVCRE